MGRSKWKTGKYRSGLEVRVGPLVEPDGFEYEPFKLEYEQPAQKRKYEPDWVNEAEKIIIEAKGRFTSQDRKKMLLVKEQHPEYHILMVFGQPFNKLSKQSPTTYAAWCDKNGLSWIGVEDLERKYGCQSSTTRKSGAGRRKTSRRKRSKA